MTPDEELNRAELAKQILDNPLVKDVLANLEREIIEGWIATSYKDETAREKAWMWANIVRKFRNTFESYITTGKMAALGIEEKRRFSVFTRGK